jgi:hypothetical protein
LQGRLQRQVATHHGGGVSEKNGASKDGKSWDLYGIYMEFVGICMFKFLSWSFLCFLYVR